jgi:hypothetical protein
LDLPYQYSLSSRAHFTTYLTVALDLSEEPFGGRNKGLLGVARRIEAVEAAAGVYRAGFSDEIVVVYF